MLDVCVRCASSCNSECHVLNCLEFSDSCCEERRMQPARGRFARFDLDRQIASTFPAHWKVGPAPVFWASQPLEPAEWLALLILKAGSNRLPLYQKTDIQANRPICSMDKRRQIFIHINAQRSIYISAL